MRQILLSNGRRSVIYLDDSLKSSFRQDAPLFDQLMALDGECFRQLEGRMTKRVILNGKAYFIKQHRGVGYREIIKNLLQMKWPVVSARNEWQALQKLNELGIPAPRVMAYGELGLNPACRESFVLMEELAPVKSLEDIAKEWKSNPPSLREKLAYIREAARIARIMHASGMNHRDFYICHLLQDLSQPALRLFVIDLHRAQIRTATPERWVIKDLAALYFSSLDAGLSHKDYFRFMKDYRQQPLSDILRHEKSFWQKVKNRGDALYRDHTGQQG
jgi:heptose I phosphotransferase